MGLHQHHQLHTQAVQETRTIADKLHPEYIKNVLVELCAEPGDILAAEGDFMGVQLLGLEGAEEEYGVGSVGGDVPGGECSVHYLCVLPAGEAAALCPDLHGQGEYDSRGDVHVCSACVFHWVIHHICTSAECQELQKAVPQNHQQQTA